MLYYTDNLRLSEIMNQTNSLYKKFGVWLNNSTWITQHSANTINSYIRIIENFLTFLDVKKIYRLNDIDTPLVKRFIEIKGNKKRYAPASMLVREAAIQLFSSWAYEKGYCRTSFYLTYQHAKLQPKKLEKTVKTDKTKRIEVLSLSEEKSLYTLLEQAEDFTGIRDACIMTLILSSALYAHELVQLTPFALNLRKKTLTLRDDTHDKRIIPIDSPRCLAWLKRWLRLRQQLVDKNYPYLFFTARKSPMSQRLLHQQISRYLNLAGIHKSREGADLLRQTAIVRLFEQNYATEDIQKRVGHKYILSTQKYANL